MIKEELVTVKFLKEIEKQHSYLATNLMELQQQILRHICNFQNIDIVLKH